MPPLLKSIILLHGAIGAADQLSPLAKELTENGYQTYSLNFSGHGQTPFQKEFGIVQFAKELKLFIEKNNLIRPDIFGYSMGGYVALHLVSQHQSLIGDIITLGTKFDWSPEIAAKEIKMLDAKTITEKVPKFAEALKIRHGSDWELMLEKTAQMMIELGSNNLLTENLFLQIKNNVLIGLADNDSMVSVEETNYAACKIAGAKRFTLENTKHPIESINVKNLAAIIIGACIK